VNVLEAITDYLCDQGHLEKRSLKSYRQRLSVFGKWCEQEHIELENINNRVVQTFLDYLREYHASSRRDRPISSHTIYDYTNYIVIFLHWCLRDEEHAQYVSLARVENIRMPRKDKILKKVFTGEEIDMLFDACQDVRKKHEHQLRDTALVSLLIDTGVRAEELMTLTLGNVMLAKDPDEDSYIWVFGKERKEREIPLGNKTRRRIARYLRECRKGAKKSDPLFLSRQGGRLVHSALRDLLRRLKQFSDLPEDVDVNPHKFRHTFASRFMREGGDIYTLSRLLGHSSVVTTEQYLMTLGVDIGRTRSRRAKYISVVDRL
jgi:integrase/recombinase XerD